MFWVSLRAHSTYIHPCNMQTPCRERVDPLWQGCCHYLWLFYVLKYKALVFGPSIGLQNWLLAGKVFSPCRSWKWEKEMPVGNHVLFHFLPPFSFPPCSFLPSVSIISYSKKTHSLKNCWPFFSNGPSSSYTFVPSGHLSSFLLSQKPMTFPFLVVVVEIHTL